MNAATQLLKTYPGSNAMCTRYNGVATKEMIQRGVEAGELEVAAGGMAIGMCTTEFSGRSCEGTFVLEEGREVICAPSCALRGLRSAAPSLPLQLRGEDSQAQAANPQT